MKSFAVLVLAATVALAAGAYFPHINEVKVADKEFLHKQEDLLILLRHVYQPDWNQQLVSYAKNYNIEKYISSYTKQEAVTEFLRLWNHGFLQKGEVFSIYNEIHREQVISLFHLFYYAKDWDTFYKTVAWARYYVNEGQFVYALTVAVTHRKDLAGFVLPAPYEIYPFYFFNTEVIQKAHSYKMQGFTGLKKIDDTFTVTIPVNYTGSYLYTNLEQKISYFTEDIGLNSYYYYFHTDYPFWMGGQEYGLVNDRRGELYLFEHQQLLARYYLERLSNGLGHIPVFSWKQPIKTGYYPSLTYYNGQAFPVRDNYYNFLHEEYLTEVELVETYERRIREIIDLGYLILPNGKTLDLTKPESIEILGNLIQSNPDSVFTRFFKYVEIFSRIIAGGAIETFEHHTVIPSVLEHFETAMRDPVFYQIYKRIISFYSQFKDMLPKYTETELTFAGVKINDVEIDKLTTFFDHFDVDITNSVDIEPEQYVEGKYTGFGEIEYRKDPFVIKARTTRLNHQAFSYKLTVTSDKITKGVVRVFLGPKYDEYGNLITLNENRENFYEIDYFVQDFVSGKNTIVRQSTDFYGYVKDRTTFFELYKTVMTSLKDETKFTLDNTEAHCGFPQRLMLPKGTKGGMPFQFFFIVSPYHQTTVETFKGFNPVLSCGVGSGTRYLDTLPFGYPFDRKLDETFFYDLPNIHFEDAMIFHKKQIEINSVL